jgi:chromosome segregation ATPase
VNVSNKLIEAIADNYQAAMIEIIGHAAEFGDTGTLDAVAEELRDAGYVVLTAGQVAPRIKELTQQVAALTAERDAARAKAAKLKEKLNDCQCDAQHIFNQFNRMLSAKESLRDGIKHIASIAAMLEKTAATLDIEAAANPKEQP